MIAYVVRIESDIKGRSYVGLEGGLSNTLVIDPDATREQAFYFKEKWRAEALRKFLDPTKEDYSLHLDAVENEVPQT